MVGRREHPLVSSDRLARAAKPLLLLVRPPDEGTTLPTQHKKRASAHTDTHATLGVLRHGKCTNARTHTHTVSPPRAVAALNTPSPLQWTQIQHHPTTHFFFFQGNTSVSKNLDHFHILARFNRGVERDDTTYINIYPLETLRKTDHTTSKKKEG